MSSCKCKQHCCHTAIHARENKSFKGSRCTNHPTRGLLRLNSTGEDSSHNQVQNSDLNHGVINTKQTHYNQHRSSYKNLVDNINMGSIINSASAYLDTATSYFGNLCPYKSGTNGLVNSKSDKSSLTYLKNMISGVSQSFNTNSMINQAPGMNSGIDSMKQSYMCNKDILEETGKPTNWNRNIFGAIHCNLLGSCSTKSEKMKEVYSEKYVPPHRRYQYDKCKSVSSTIDPKLTPYNARLLENSKKNHHSILGKDLLAKSHQCEHKTEYKADNCEAEQKTNSVENPKLDPQKTSTEKSKIGSSLNSDSKSCVLYVRSSRGKRGKPSAKKRRRQRARQNEQNDQTSCHSDKSSSNIKPNSALHDNSVMAFILGYSSDKSETEEKSETGTNSFHFSCDIDDELDWSDSDLESDETCSSLEDENIFENGLGFQCNNPLLGLQCFQVTCTVQPPEEAILSPNSSAIENINLLWKIQVSVKSENPKKESSTSKKVHFADDNDLATVHPMIAWSHAYQAARKGPWEQYARDRGRFLRKITDGEKLLEPILNQNHRDKIYRERFLEK